VLTVVEDFEGSDLDAGRWVPHYLPHWSSRAESRATYAVDGSVLRLSIPTTQGLWCGDRHSPALRTSTIASGLFAGTLGSTVGQQPFVTGLTVTEEQHEFRGWLLGHGRLSVTARANLSPRSMVSVWLTGFEDAPDRCGEVCVFEVFGDTLSEGRAGVGAGVHKFRDPALREDFSVIQAAIDLREWHRFEVEMRPDGCTWWLDEVPLRTADQCPAYPLQLFVGVFDFPDRDDGTLGDRVPFLDVDEIIFVPEG
jgi:hypothetical protein